MKKEKTEQMTLKIQEVNQMSIQNIPYSNKSLLKWSCFRVEKFEDISNPKKSFELVLTPLTELVKQDGYEQFKDKLNWLYNNYSKENYQLVWSELQDYNERRKIKFIQDNLIARADYILNKQVEEWKHHFGEIPAWIEKLTDNQRQLLLDRALTCYGLKPEEIVLETKQVYTIPQQIIKERAIVSTANKAFQIETPSGEYTKKVLRNNEIVEVKYNIIELDEVTKSVYYSQEELAKDRRRKLTVKNYYNDVVGRFKFYSKELQRLAENAVIRDARWMAKFNDTEFDLREHREVEDTTDFEDRMQHAIEYVTRHHNELPAKELVATAMWLYDIKPTEYNKNRMVPVTDMQGPDSPYGLDIEFRDFLEPIYEDGEGL